MGHLQNFAPQPASVLRTYVPVALPTPAFSQPQIAADAMHLGTYEHGGLWLDLYGINSKAGITVWDIAPVGTRLSLGSLLTDEPAANMNEWCERQAKRERSNAGFDGACALMMRAQ